MCQSGESPVSLRSQMYEQVNSIEPEYRELTLVLIRIASGLMLRCTSLAWLCKKDIARETCKIPFWIWERVY